MTYLEGGIYSLMAGVLVVGYTFIKSASWYKRIRIDETNDKVKSKESLEYDDMESAFQWDRCKKDLADISKDTIIEIDVGKLTGRKDSAFLLISNGKCIGTKYRDKSDVFVIKMDENKEVNENKSSI
ncbi:MAG TPA: hypothetical protein VIK26_10950 [Clostridium sp.]